MKKLLFALFTFVLLSRPSLVFAHLAGQAAFFKIDGRYSSLYPVPVTSLENFSLPQDAAPSNYLVGQFINFEIDLSKFPGATEMAAKTKFNWDFGDGQSGYGTSISHIFKNQGSYILSIYADDGTTGGKPQLFESVILNILPNSDYKLPKAVILVNGKSVKDPLADILRFPFSDNLKFDANGSIPGSGKIVDYFWDFGDRQSSLDSVIDHTFDRVPGQGQVFPVLRIRDENGFIADTFAEIDNQNSLQKVPKVSGEAAGITKPGSRTNQIKFTLTGVVAVVAVAFLIRFVFLRKKR